MTSFNLKSIHGYLALYLLVLTTQLNAQNTPAQIDSFFSIRFPGQLNGALLLSEKDRVVYHKAFGMADFKTHQPVTPNSLYNLASVSKVITSTAVLQLVEKGKVALDAPLQKYLPAFPYPDIRIRHLLTHTSGLPDLQLYESIVKQYPDTIINNTNIIPALKAWDMPLPFSPGEKWQYSNTNYDLLLLLVEKVSRMSYSQYLKKNIFDPAGMKESFVALDPRNAKGITAHVFANWYTEQFISADSIPRFKYINYNLGGLAGATNIITTPEDMYHFDKAIFSGKLLKKETLELAHTPVKLNDGSTFYEGSMDTMLGEGKGSYGMGWSIFDQPGFGRSVGHGGFNYGLATFYFHNQTNDQTIIAFDNTAGQGFGKVVTSSLLLLNGQRGIEKINKISLARIYGAAMKEKGIDEATVIFNSMRGDTAHYYTNERELNWLGYDFLRANFDGSLKLALEVFKVNTLLFPKSFNVFDSYGEALLKSGKKEEAILMYKKSLNLNPDNKGAKDALEKILNN